MKVLLLKVRDDLKHSISETQMTISRLWHPRHLQAFKGLLHFVMNDVRDTVSLYLSHPHRWSHLREYSSSSDIRLSLWTGLWQIAWIWSNMSWLRLYIFYYNSPHLSSYLCISVMILVNFSMPRHTMDDGWKRLEQHPSFVLWSLSTKLWPTWEVWAVKNGKGRKQIKRLS